MYKTIGLPDYSISGRQDVSQLAYHPLTVMLGGDRFVQVQGAAADQTGAVVAGQRCQDGDRLLRVQGLFGWVYAGAGWDGLPPVQYRAVSMSRALQPAARAAPCWRRSSRSWR